jgi:hypothetical protein
MESNWRTLLQRLARIETTDEFPLLVYRVAPSRSQTWPAELPVNKAILDFYALSDGGYIGDYQWYTLSELPSIHEQWMDRLAHYYPNESSPLLKGRHLVLALDSGGAPLIWDSQEDKVATFWFKGGDWEPTGFNMEEFLTALFAPKQEDTLWFEALQQLRRPV